ncbi:MAG: hypothetical protein R8G66_02990 [Cytophagales bacterium]|nr:hypothetical protein [Cytophagales bacterium]
MNLTHLHLGTFNAEYFWKPPNMAGFPSIIDPQSRNLIYAMDDLLALSASNQDYLLTRFGFEETHKSYLEQLGITFHSNIQPVITPSINGHKGFQCISEALTLNLNLVPKEIDRIHPYSITQSIGTLSQKLDADSHLPDHDLVAKVNSKAYSTMLSKSLLPNYEGQVIRSSKDLEVEGNKLLKNHNRLVLKESYGVAGNGNLILDSEKTLNQIGRQFNKQENKGRRVELIIEPFMDKIIDFSSHWHIDEDGTRNFLGFQEMINEGFAFSQIRPLASKWESLIQQSDYLSIINDALLTLYHEGYYGPVCIDSMILKDHKIAPIIEINARQSMGLLSHQLNERFKDKGGNGTLFYLSLMVPSGQQDLYNTIHELLKELSLAFSLESPKGFMVLSANTLRANAKLDTEKPYRARLYLWHHDPKENTLNTDISRLITALQTNGIHVQ